MADARDEMKISRTPTAGTGLFRLSGAASGGA